MILRGQCEIEPSLQENDVLCWALAPNHRQIFYLFANSSREQFHTNDKDRYVALPCEPIRACGSPLALTL